MGLVGFFDFVFKCIQLLAWPSFALGYPLCASIKAIETNSNNQMRKLVTYWIIFSLGSLFEHTFSKLLEWVPLWSYMKIVAICWLVIPRFNGASIAYMHLVRPCLSMQLLQTVLDLFNKKPDLSQKDESFLVVAERYVNENGTEALEKLIASKPIIKEPMVAQKDIKEPMVAEKDIKAVETLDEVASVAENKTMINPNVDIEVKNMTSLSENVLPIPPYINVQKEWTCAMCQVTTQSEATLNSHLQGMKHRARCEELKGGKPTVTKKGLFNARPNIKRTCAICQVTTHGEVTWISHLQGTKHKAKVAEAKEQKQKKVCSATKPDEATKDPKKGKGPNNKFGCDLCQVTLQSEATLKSHIRGEKHKSKCEQLKAKETIEKDKTSSSAKNSEQANRSSTRNVPAGGLDKGTVTVMIKVQANVNNGYHSCSMCNVTCTSKSDMASHLRGRNHLSQIEDSVQSSSVHYWCNICDVTCKSNIDMSSHLSGTKHATRLVDSA